MSREKLPPAARRGDRAHPLVLTLTLLLACPAAGQAQSAAAGHAGATGTGTPAAAGVSSAGEERQPPPETPTDWREILPGLTVGSQLRLRGESRRNFKFDDARAGNDEGYLLARVRLGLTWRPSEQVTGAVVLQDARIHGEEAISETRTPNVFADQLDVHQAYLDVEAAASSRIPIAVRVGRQKLVYGSQRLVSPLEWVNTARVFDGVRVAIGAGTGRRLDAFATRLVPVAPRGLNDHGLTGSRLFNSQLHGVYYTDGALLPDGAVEGYWLLRREGRLADAVHTIGTRIDARYGPWTFDGELAGQTGSYGGLDQRAAMMHVGGSFTTRLPGRPRLGAAFNLGSGDDDPHDGVHGTFDNLYPLNHVYYGTMDLFALQNLRNVEVSVDTALPGGASVRVAYQHFALVAPGTDAWYNAAAGIVHAGGDPHVAADVGSEIDVTVRARVWHVGLEAGYGYFAGGGYLRELDFRLSSAHFFYLQTTVGF